MKTKVLIVAVVENENGEILLRKKPAGSPPYEQTWYIFGAEFMAGEELDAVLANHIEKQTGIKSEIVDRLGWDHEIKPDIDGETKHFIYLDVLSRYVSGELTLSPGVEKLEWVAKDKLHEYDNVPPSVKLFKKLGWIKEANS